jgi:hypothetical protein
VTEPKIVASPKDLRRASPLDSSQAWAILGWVGLTFLVVGGADFVLTWYPATFGSREWEFGTVTSSFNGLPILVLGLGLLLAAAAVLQRSWWTLLSLLAAIILLLWILAAAVLWATTVPLALASTPPELVTGIKKAIAKTTVQSVVYPVILAFLVWRSFAVLRGPGSRT